MKSLTTDEIGLNDALARPGSTPIETDLAERIVQLAGERPSHLLVPSLHRGRPEIAELLRESSASPGLPDDAPALLAAARRHLRDAFLRARVAVSGANFAVAETGTVGVVESEGNGRMCTTLPETLVTVMGIEKVVERVARPRRPPAAPPALGDRGADEPLHVALDRGVGGRRAAAFHLVLVDAGRTRALADPDREAGASLHPLLGLRQRLPRLPPDGGHAYDTVYAGPIGAILQPQLRGSRGRRRRCPIASLALRRVRRRVPGRDRHPADPRARAREGRAHVERPASTAVRCGRSRGRSRRASVRARAAARARPPAARGARRAGALVPGPARGLGSLADAAGRRRPDVPRVVGERVSEAREAVLGADPRGARRRRGRLPRCRAATRRRARARPTTSSRDSSRASRRLARRRSSADAPRRRSSAALADARRVARRRRPRPATAASDRRASSSSRTPSSRRASSTPSTARSRPARSPAPRPGRSRSTAAPARAGARSRSCPTSTCASSARGQVVETVPELFERLAPSRARGPADRPRVRPVGDVGHRLRAGRGRPRPPTARRRARRRSDRAVDCLPTGCSSAW